MTFPPGNDETSSTLGTIIYRVHAANDREREWLDVLDLLRDWLRARVATLSRHHFVRGEGDTLYDAPQDPEFRAAYAEYAPRNPWFLSSIDYTAGRVMTGDELIGTRDLLRTDFYRSLLKPRRLFHRLCGVVARRGDLAYFIDAHRSEDDEPFGETDKANLKCALPHISLALENRWRWAQAGDLAKALMRIVDQDAHPTLLLSPECRVLYRNTSAGDLTLEANGLHVRGERLVAATATDNRSLREAMLAVSHDAALGAETASRVLTISVPGGAHPSILIARTAGRGFLSEAGEFCQLVMVMTRNAHSEHDPRNCPFARQFELTPAQARVSALVFTGHPLLHIARSLQVSENTVRTHLKQIFQKTNTHGQMELVHLHARVCADRR
jgi:DNA-binding CsgD family transcriptional regulator